MPTLDPGISAGAPAATVSRHVYEGLVAMTEDGKIVPELASDWGVSANGLGLRRIAHQLSDEVALATLPRSAGQPRCWLARA